MSDFKKVASKKEDVFEEFIFRVLGKYDDGNITCDSVVANFMRENNFSNIKMGEINSMIDKLCELSESRGEIFQDRVRDELVLIGKMTAIALKEVSGVEIVDFAEKVKTEIKNTPNEYAESIGQRLLSLD